MSQALHPMLNIAIKAARAAGAIINRASLDIERVTVTAKSHNDFVTEVDKAAEEAIIATILEAYPGHGILAEESGRTHGARHSEYVWIIDPLDGTTNFIHGFPVYAVSIALSYRNQIQQAVVYDPTRNDLFYASKGKGAYLNDRRIRVSKRTRMLEALIGTGFPFRKGDNFQRYMKMFEEVMVQCAGLRRPGAASLDLCYVAAGFYDGFFETGLSPWDVAAGSLIITEAGGLVGNFTGEPDYLYQRELVAGTPRIYGQLVKTLAPYSRVISEEETAAADGQAAEATHQASTTPGVATQADEQTPLQALKAAAGEATAGRAEGAGEGAQEGSQDAAAPEAAPAPVKEVRRIRVTPPADRAEAGRSMEGGRPERAGGDGPRGDRPRGDGPRGDGPRGDRPRGDRPGSDRGARPYRAGEGSGPSHRGPREGGPSSSGPRRGGNGGGRSGGGGQRSR